MASTVGASTMRGASADAMAQLREQLDGVTGSADRGAMADDLFGAARLLRAEPGLRRVAADVSIDAAAKQGLLRSIFEGKVQAESLELIESAVGRRWTATRDLADALEHLGEVAVVKSAGSGAGRLGDELFTVEQALGAHPELRDALSDPGRSAQDKRTLIDTLLGDRALPETVTLLKQSLAGTYRTVGAALAAYQRAAAAERDQQVATVRVARELSAADRERLQSALSQQYGRRLHLNVTVDPELLGGVRVEVGDEVIDGSVAARLDDARRRLAG